MGSAGHCPRCSGHLGFCSDHSVCHPCNCPPPPKRGWECPVCGRGVAPDVKECSHGQDPHGTSTVYVEYP